jgi:resuscitation-promoting factor RpfB
MSVRNGLLRIAAAACVAGMLAACAPPEPERTQDVAEVAAETTAPAAEETPTAAPTPTAPAVEVKAVTVTQAIPFRRTTVKDSTLTEGTRKVRTRGVAGVKTLTYEVTYSGGRETARKLLRQVVTKQPVAEVTAVGTKKAQPTRQCDPNYSGCVPVASDVDCAGGSGNGPAYVSGPVTVIGDDVYDLDRDSDGIACE